jgi:hypothetical protein
VEPPSEIDGARVLCFAVVGDDVKPIGATRHSFGSLAEGELKPGPPLPPFDALAIATYDKDDGYYLFYLDADLGAVTDTWHETVEAVKRQAEFEYEGITEKWVALSD